MFRGDAEPAQVTLTIAGFDHRTCPAAIRERLFMRTPRLGLSRKPFLPADVNR